MNTFQSLSLGEKRIDDAVSEELEHIWSRVQAEIALTVDEPTYQIWLEPLRAVELSGNRLLIEAPPQACRWVRDRFGKVLEAAVEIVLGAGTTVELMGGVGVQPAVARPRSAQRGRSLTQSVGDEATQMPALPPAAGPLGNPKLTFDQFVIGDCNRLAHAAALTVAEMPAQAYNPLFICGPPGVGKTHLLSSIATLLLSHSPGLTVRCTTGEAFTNEFIGALGAGHTEGFKARFRDIDVLLMDDVQFLERKTRTEEEFFHTFNALHDGGRQIVVTSDRPPRDLQALEDRLRERFEAGLVADITPPEMPTRLAILRMRVHHDQIKLADDAALRVIAERIENHVRALEGALIRVVAYSSLTGRPITVDLAQEVLDSLYPQTASTARATRSVGDIQAAACACFDVSPEELLSSSRTPRLAWPRQLAMYLSRELTDESLPAIGRHFGGRDHTTVLHAWRRTTARIATDETAREAVEKLCRALGTPAP
ncbi:MAG: chromosomal replication initiator protein DnaA [Solirubrobacterales bacterium]|nr:chromosomal replication initiator protein DnaA [Solirubrobacterales bacterium]